MALKKILIITGEFPPGPGGIGNHAYNLAKFLARRGHRLTVLAVSDYATSEEEKVFDQKEEFEIFRFARYGNRIKTLQERVKKIKHITKSREFDLIIFSGRFSLLVSLLLRKGNSRFAAIAHGGDVNPQKKSMRQLVNTALKKMDLIIPVSNFSKSKLPANISKDRIVVIPNGFDVEGFNGNEYKHDKALNGSLKLITVGTIWPRKGHHNVLDALPEILRKHPDAVYSIIGRHADTTIAEKYFKDEKIKNHLKIMGSVSNEKMFDELKDSQIFIMLSETQPSGDFEGFGIAVIEANIFGLPAIGSKNSGLEDSIDNGVSGILVNPKDKKEISDAVDMILADYRRFSSNAGEWAVKHHWSNIVMLYENAFEKII